MSEQSINKTVRAVLDSDSSIEQKSRKNTWITMGVAGAGALLVTLSATTRNRFQYAQVCIPSRCNQNQYILIQAVYSFFVFLALSRFHTPELYLIQLVSAIYKCDCSSAAR